MFEDVLQAADKEEEGEKGKEKDQPNLSKPIQETVMEAAETEQEEKLLLSSPGQNGMSKGEAFHSANGIEPSADGTGEMVDEENDCHEGEEIKEESNAMGSEEDFLTLPPACVLSPLSKSVEAVVTPLVRLCVYGSVF